MRAGQINEVRDRPALLGLEHGCQLPRNTPHGTQPLLTYKYVGVVRGGSVSKLKI